MSAARRKSARKSSPGRKLELSKSDDKASNECPNELHPILIHEVGPRDGLQNESTLVATSVKIELVRRLTQAGLRRIEVTSFVSPKWIPQLADGDAVASEVPQIADVEYSALVPNERGYERMRDTNVSLPALFVSASELHNRKNLNCSIDESIDDYAGVAARAKIEGYRLRAYVSMVCGCPFEGEVSVGAVVRVVERLRKIGVDEVSLGDTIGIGQPRQIKALVKAVREVIPIDSMALHLHDTYGRALANVQAGYESGVRIFDSSVGGLGGCPYAPGASGNVPTEDVVDLFERQGIDTGVKLEALLEVVAWLEAEVLQRKLEGRVYRAHSKGPAPKASGAKTGSTTGRAS